MAERDVIPMKAERDDEGELHYTQDTRPSPKPRVVSLQLNGILGIAIGVVLFLVLLTFFFYVVLPLIVILIVYSYLKGMLTSRWRRR